MQMIADVRARPILHTDDLPFNASDDMEHGRKQQRHRRGQRDQVRTHT